MENIIHQGVLRVPPGYDLADMEGLYRAWLWPRVRPGYSRYRRRFMFTQKGDLKEMVYRIVDVPDQHAEERKCRAKNGVSLVDCNVDKKRRASAGGARKTGHSVLLPAAGP